MLPVKRETTKPRRSNNVINEAKRSLRVPLASELLSSSGRTISDKKRLYSIPIEEQRLSLRRRRRRFRRRGTWFLESPYPLFIRSIERERDSYSSTRTTTWSAFYVNARRIFISSVSCFAVSRRWTINAVSSARFAETGAADGGAQEE